MPKTDYEKHQEALARQLGGEIGVRRGPATVQEMRRASAIDDEELLQELIKLGIGPESLMLMSVAPLVALAWVDGEVQPGEREAILRAAAAKGIVARTPAYELLATWLVQRPGDELLEAWEQFVKTVIAKWPQPKAEKFQKQVGDLARMVAKAAGGVLGIGAVSAQEAALIHRIEGAFDLSSR